MTQIERPLLLYDGECGFCRRWITRWKRLTGERVDYAPFQEKGDQFPEIPKASFINSVQLVEPDGKISSGAEAVFRTLSYAPRREWMLRIYEKVPGVAPVTEWGYRFVARHRSTF